MLGAIAEFERDLINERVREGIEAAKKKGVQFIFGILYSLGYKYYLEELKNGAIDLEKLKK